MTNDEILTIKEVAALLKLAVGQWRIRRSKLDRWMDKQPRGGAHVEG